MAILLGFVSFVIFILFQAQGIAGGDSGDLVTAACTFGVPHPPGYPLYTFLGYILCKLPLFTPSWRVALLSSVPHALVIAGIFYLIRNITKNTLVSIFGTLLLLGNYMFFLYSVTPEVFALFDLFIVVLTLLLFRFTKIKDIGLWYAICFVFGLSLTHHHVVLFMVPAYLYWIYIHKNIFRGTKKITLISNSIACVFLGISPYIYVVFAGYGHSIVVWDQPTTISNFIRLVTRSDYGTFISNGLYGQLLWQRILSVAAYMQFLYMDFRAIGVIGILTGFYVLRRTQRTLFWFLALAIGSIGPAFFFYASFPLINRFTLGTYERFLLPSYVLLTVVCSVGLLGLYRIITKVLSKYKNRLITNVTTLTFRGFLGFYVLFTILGVLYRFWGLPQDRTMDLYATDILTSIPHKSILFLEGDTPLFSVQYMRYVVGVRPDVVVLHNSRLGAFEYLEQLRIIFPSVIFSDDMKIPVRQRIISDNYPNYRIFANRTDIKVVETGYVWVPRGLVYELYPDTKTPSIADVQIVNDKLWQQFHDPTTGILQRYNHMMLSNVRDMYAYSRMLYGNVLYRAGEYASAIREYSSAISYSGDMYTAEMYMNLGLAQAKNKNCEDAVISFQRSRRNSIGAEYERTKAYESWVYETCLDNSVKAKQLMDEFNASEESKDIRLEKL